MSHIVVASILALLVLACAISDARTYRIPDILTGTLFNTVMLSSVCGWWFVPLSDALAGFLFSYPVLLMLWHGRSVNAPPASGVIANSHTGNAYLSKDVVLSYMRMSLLPSPVSWLLWYLVGSFMVDPFMASAGVVAAGSGALMALFPNKPCMMGGGDKKMLAGCFAAFGLSGLPDFILWLTVCNMLLIIWLLSWRAFRRSSGVTYEAWERRRIPMGVSIALAALLCGMSALCGISAHVLVAYITGHA